MSISLLSEAKKCGLCGRMNPCEELSTKLSETTPELAGCRFAVVQPVALPVSKPPLTKSAFAGDAAIAIATNTENNNELFTGDLRQGERIV